ncbi:hypothetical protein JCM10914A_51080 [Paenibacillus sp. JCM 10914]|uniref:transglutaminase domain-containing protein n=1 Tax=Paenibacillus sp. JCM 10914 TaxID=1236974 RepID=UPI0003CC81BF|nr:hypothetical protein [Paenibacillus sp. JCM 10914]GAE05195.1 hypothetical protein JCM10914_1286 [Paenibacillus sp. JCM 10914]
MFGYIHEFNDYYIKLLQLAAYSKDNSDPSCKFSYQSQTDRELATLKNSYQLDTIAGHGDEISQWKNLTQWLNGRHPHGNVQPPDLCNAVEVLKLSDDSPVTMNCYVLATVLNEMFLSLGYHSRRVHCRSYDAYDLDSHVVTTVYSKTYRKWLFFDPSWNCYVTDDNEMILSLQEFRNRLMNNLPVWVNGNPAESEWSTFYKGYMAKNMFWFSCPVDSEFDGQGNSHCVLLPEHFLPMELTRALPSNMKHIITRNPDHFWIQPL